MTSDRIGDSLLRMNPVDYLRLVKHVVNGMHANDEDEYDEMYSDGVVGLVDAARRFDESRGIKASTYLVPRIRGEILDGKRRRDPLERNLRKSVKLLDDGSADLSPKERLAAEHAKRALAATRLDARDEDGHTIIELVGAWDADPTELGDERLQALLPRLHPRLRYVLEQRFLQERRLHEIAADLRVTESYISLLVREGLRVARALHAGEPVKRRLRSFRQRASGPSPPTGPEDSAVLAMQQCLAGWDVLDQEYALQAFRYGLSGERRTLDFAESTGITRRSWSRRFRRRGLQCPQHWIQAGWMIGWLRQMGHRFATVTAVAKHHGRDPGSLNNQCYRMIGLRPHDAVDLCANDGSVLPVIQRMRDYLVVDADLKASA